MAEFKVTNIISDNKKSDIDEIIETDIPDVDDDQQSTEKKPKMTPKNIRESGSFSVSIDSTNDKSDHF